ncbi:MAG: hypothetical protein PSX81_02355 [bacterium]|nr:hypothetical protein [bacterium]
MFLYPICTSKSVSTAIIRCLLSVSANKCIKHILRINKDILNGKYGVGVIAVFGSYGRG